MFGKKDQGGKNGLCSLLGLKTPGKKRRVYGPQRGERVVGNISAKRKGEKMKEEVVGRKKRGTLSGGKGKKKKKKKKKKGRKT